MSDLHNDTARRSPPPFSQLEMARLLAAMHGNDTALRDRPERACRFVEEALETAQAVGLPKERVLALVEYVYDRPASTDAAQELGGVLTMLTALATACEVDLLEAANREFARMWQNIDRIREKQRRKPAGVVATHALPEPDAGEVTVIDVQKQYSEHLGGRFAKHGMGSAEKLRDRLLLPALQKGGKVKIDFGRALACASFTEELFGGLVRAGLSEADLRARLEVTAEFDDQIAERAWEYIGNAAADAAPPFEIDIERDHAGYMTGPFSVHAERAAALRREVVIPALQQHSRVLLRFGDRLPSTTFNKELFEGLVQECGHRVWFRVSVQANDNGGTANEAALFMGRVLQEPSA